jgi:hypothetical protein
MFKIKWLYIEDVFFFEQNACGKLGGLRNEREIVPAG